MDNSSALPSPRFEMLSLIDRRLHECRANRFPLPSTLAEVRDELAVIADVCSKVIEAVDDLLRSARTGLNETQLHEQVAQPLEGFLGVPVPQQMLEALQALRYLGAGLWPFLLQGLCLLLQHCQPHGDVKPIDQMLAKRMQILLHPPDILTAIRHEYHLLILLH